MRLNCCAGLPFAGHEPVVDNFVESVPSPETAPIPRCRIREGRPPAVGQRSAIGEAVWRDRRRSGRRPRSEAPAANRRFRGPIRRPVPHGSGTVHPVPRIAEGMLAIEFEAQNAHRIRHDDINEARSSSEISRRTRRSNSRQERSSGSASAVRRRSR